MEVLMAESILDYEKRPARYSAIDGIDEMLIGFFFLTTTLTMHATNIASADSFWRWKYSFFVANALLLIAFFMVRKLLKERVTYRRTGFVKYRNSKVKSVLGGIVGFASGGAALTCLLILWPRPQRERYLILLGSVLWAAFYMYFFVYKTGMHRAYRYVMAVLMVASPLAVYSMFENVRDISTLTVVAPGTCWFFSGVITFWSYLHQTHPADPESEDAAK
jgi:hypothetical protein